MNNMTCLLLSSNRRLCSQPRNCDLRFSLGRGKEICVFSWGQFIGSRYWLFLLLLLALFFFSFDVWYGATTWSTSLWASKFMFVFRWSFSFPFPLLADFVSVCFRHLLHRIDHFYFLSVMKKIPGAKACDSK